MTSINKLTLVFFYPLIHSVAVRKPFYKLLAAFFYSNEGPYVFFVFGFLKSIFFFTFNSIENMFQN